MTHEERIEDFYRRQAHAYDNFRERLLHGRKELFDRLPVSSGDIWIDWGGGTARNLEFMGERIHEFGKIYIVDMSASLLEQARRRVNRHGWNNVELIHGDALAFMPREGRANLITCSYSLTMIQAWRDLIQLSSELLVSGGRIGIVDFYVSAKNPPPGREQHGVLCRRFWPWWFAHDDVMLTSEHLPLLEHMYACTYMNESRGSVPYLPFVKAPYYQFIGTKK